MASLINKPVPVPDAANEEQSQGEGAQPASPEAKIVPKPTVDEDVANKIEAVKVPDLDLPKRMNKVAHEREQNLSELSALCESQLRHYEESGFYRFGIRHHFLRHSEIIDLQNDQSSKIPRDCLFNALSYKLGGNS